MRRVGNHLHRLLEPLIGHIVKQQRKNNGGRESQKRIETDEESVSIGSAAICIENSEVYMLNSKRQWVIL